MRSIVENEEGSASSALSIFSQQYIINNIYDEKKWQIVRNNNLKGSEDTQRPLTLVDSNLVTCKITNYRAFEISNGSFVRENKTLNY